MSLFHCSFGICFNEFEKKKNYISEAKQPFQFIHTSVYVFCCRLVFYFFFFFSSLLPIIFRIEYQCIRLIHFTIQIINRYTAFNFIHWILQCRSDEWNAERNSFRKGICHSDGIFHFSLFLSLSSPLLSSLLSSLSPLEKASRRNVPSRKCQ